MLIKKWKYIMIAFLILCVPVIGLTYNGSTTKANYISTPHSSKQLMNYTLKNNPSASFEFSTQANIPVHDPEIKSEPTSSDHIVIIEETEFHLIEEEKFSRLITIANKHNAHLYGIPYSDVFAIIKDGEILFNTSTGIAVADIGNREIILEYFSGGEWSDYVGIVEDIEHVIETGNEISVEHDNYIGYHITKESNRIIVSW